jgi:diguanylate cyclase (GGDEF)-like protein
MFNLGNLLGIVGLLLVLLRPYPQPYRLPAWAAGVCALVLAPLYLLAHLQGLPGQELTVLPSYSKWVWLDLALWNTINLCVMMLASFRALLVLTRQARTDPLTGCLNRRGLEEEVALLATRNSQGVPVVVLSMDIDHFKAINDRWGHAAGDAYLKAFAAEVRTCIRQTDLLARMGGEEFVALLIGSDEGAGHRVATKILEGVRRLRVPHDQHEIQATVSVGLGTGRGLSPKALQALQARSDEAVYAAKRSGRDRIGPVAH